MATVRFSVPTNLQIYVRSAETSKYAWNNFARHFELKTLSRKIFYRIKLYSAKLEKGTDIVNDINYIKTFLEH